MLRDRCKSARTLRSRRLFGNRRHQSYETKHMFRAIRYNRVSVVKSLLKSGKVDLKAREAHPGNGYLHLAAYFGNVAVAKLLLRAGCRVNAWNSRCFTPLHLALHKAKVPVTDRLIIVQILLDHRGHVNATNANGDTPLHVMAESNACHAKIIALLLKHGADLGRKNNEGKMPFHEYIFAQESCFGADQTLLKLLLPDGDRHGMSPMHEACLFHKLNTVKEMVEKGAEIDALDKFNRTPLYYAVVSKKNGPSNENKKSIVRLLLDHGADINQNFTENRYSVENLVVELAYNLRDYESFKTFLEYAAKFLAMLSKTSNEFRRTYFHYFKYMRIEYFQVSTNRSVVEIEEMKTSTLGESSISFYQLLEADSEETMVYARNRETVKAFESSGYETRFPMFEGLLRASLDRGFLRLRLIEEASVFLSKVFHYPNPSLPVFEKILTHLYDEELKCLLSAREKRLVMVTK